MLDLALPSLRLVAPAVSPPLAAQIDRGLAKFARNTSQPAFTITTGVRVIDPDADRAARLDQQANVRYQFVVGREERDRATYAAADGSSAQVDFDTGCLTLELTRDVFEAPHSTWSDLLSAPLAAAWRHHGFYPLHAASVSFDTAAAVIIGPSGAGKTTTALALVEGGGAWRADDKLLLHDAGDAVSAMSLYANTNLAPATIAAHPSLRFALERPPINDTNDKRPCALDEIGRRVDLSPFVPTALFFVQQTSCVESRLHRLSETDALLMLSAQSPAGARREAVKGQHQLLVAMARQLPAWRLESGRDVLERPVTFASGIRECLAGTPSVA